MDAGFERSSESGCSGEQMIPKTPETGHLGCDRACCDNRGEGPSVYDLPIPQSMRDEWLRLASRRHFLGRMGKTLGWAGLAVLLGDRFLGGVAHASEPAFPAPESLHLPNFPPAAKRSEERRVGKECRSRW